MNIAMRAGSTILLTFSAFSCAPSSVGCDPATAACASPALPVVALGQDVVIAPGQTVEVGPDRVSLQFVHVLSDSRCPTDVQCVWAGNATARVRVRSESDTSRTVELNTTLEPREARFDGYVLRFIALTPEPESTTRIDPASYRLTVRLERTN